MTGTTKDERAATSQSLEVEAVAKHKVLKSVAHNVAHSFTSAMNYFDGYIMDYLLQAARATEKTTLRVDLLTGQGGPEELMTPPVTKSVQNQADWFPQLVQRSGADMEFVRSAQLTLKFANPSAGSGQCSFTCTVEIGDERGKVHEGAVEGLW